MADSPSHRRHQQAPETHLLGADAGAAADYYYATSPIPVPGATHQPPMLHVAPHFVFPDNQGLVSRAPVPTTSTDLASVRAGAAFALDEYVYLQRRPWQHQTKSMIDEQHKVVSTELGRLSAHVKEVAASARRHRWRRWLIGGIVGTLVPAVRALFRRPGSYGDGNVDALNDTEYAFSRSKSIIQRVLDSLRGGWDGLGRLASTTMLVFAVLFVFQNEVTLRVARTLRKRLKRLSLRIETGGYEVSDKDLDILKGWRWRILSGAR